jgi:hypothetical protein
MSGRPYLSLFHQASSAHAILMAAGGGLSFGFASAEGLAETRADLTRALVTLATEPRSLGSADADSYAPYTARAVAGQFAAVFDRVGR